MSSITMFFFLSFRNFFGCLISGVSDHWLLGHSSISLFFSSFRQEA
uniref:Uncharacterized protein n=1 Tax=Rhizophora mucronata TaxID=61149 RepID=A0A2P2QU37_RHIMU